VTAVGRADDLVARIMDRARAEPDLVAVNQDSTEVSFAGLVERVEHTAGQLRARGIGPGSVVGVHARPSVAGVVALLAVTLISLVWGWFKKRE